MTANNGPLLDDDDVVGMLRSAAQGGPDATHRDTLAAMAAGRKIRHWRRTLQLVGSGAGVAGVAAFAILLGGVGSGVQTVVEVPAAAAPATGDAPAPVTAEAISTTEIILDALGPDFREGTMDEQGQVMLVPGSPSAEKLPDGYQAAVRLIEISGKADFTLEQQCKASVEKGSHQSACRPVTLPDGRTAQVQDRRTVLGEYNPSGDRRPPAASDQTTVNVDRGDGSFVRLDFIAFDSYEASSVARQKIAVAWLKPYTDTLIAIASDPRIAGDTTPGQGEVEAAPANERNQGYLQDALGASFSLIDGAVTLEPGSAKEGELPSRYYSGAAELTFTTKAAFEAVCAARAGLKACEERMLPDGSTVYLRSWADRDAEASELRGESAVFFIRPDGGVVRALLTVLGRNVTSDQRDAQVAGVTSWFDSLQDALVTAATDERLTAPAAAE